jgi:hypothetical protein
MKEETKKRNKHERRENKDKNGMENKRKLSEE